MSVAQLTALDTHLAKITEAELVGITPAQLKGLVTSLTAATVKEKFGDLAAKFSTAQMATLKQADKDVLQPPA